MQIRDASHVPVISVLTYVQQSRSRYYDLIENKRHESTENYRMSKGRNVIYHGDHFHALPGYAWAITTDPALVGFVTDPNMTLATYRTQGQGLSGIRRKPRNTVNYVEGTICLDIEQMAHLLGMVAGQNHRIEPNVPPLLLSEAKTLALNRLTDSNVNFGQLAGELAESADLMTTSLVRLANMLRAVRNRQWNKLANDFGVVPSKKTRTSTKFAESWLAYKLGWQPLVNDVFNAYSSIQDSLRRPDLISVEGDVESKVPITNQLTGIRCTGSIRHFARCGIKARIGDREAAHFSNLGLTNPFAIGWELLPLSFLFDYFVEAGNFLSALGASSGLLFEDGYITSGTTGGGNVEFYGMAASLRVQGYKGSTPRTAITCKVYKRDILGDFPMPRVHLGSGLNSFQRQSIFGALFFLSKFNRGNPVDLKKYGLAQTPPSPHFGLSSHASNQNFDSIFASKS